jgi:hypothetical protein
MYWVDPFVARLVYAPMQLRDAIITHFRKHQHWKTGRLQSKKQLHAVVWLHYLQDNWDNDPRFQLFDMQERWVNPWNRQVHDRLRRADFLQNKQRFRRRVAAELADDPASQINDLPNAGVLHDWLADQGIHTSVDDSSMTLHASESESIASIQSDTFEVDWPEDSQSSMGSSFFNAPSGVIYPTESVQRRRLGSSDSISNQSLQALSVQADPSHFRTLDVLRIPIAEACNDTPGPLAVAWQQPVLKQSQLAEHVPMLTQRLSPSIRTWLSHAQITPGHQFLGLPGELPLQSAFVHHPGLASHATEDCLLVNLNSGHTVAVMYPSL